MRDREAVAATVRGMLTSACPELHALRDDTGLGDDDLGLDSVEIAELLLACEDEFGARVEPLLDGSRLTFGRVVDHFASP